MPSSLKRLVFACLGVLLIATGCTDAPADLPTESPSPTTAPSEAPSPPELQDFSAEAASMASWSDKCAPIDFDPLLDHFGNLESVEIESELDSDPIRDAAWSGACTADPNLDGSTADITVFFDAFDTNVAAFDHFHEFAWYTHERFSDAEIDYETQLGSDTAWNASRITAQEEPTVSSAERAIAVAVLLGDFYTVEITVRFRPGMAIRAGCEPSAADDCALTATELAEFMATSGYLDGVHEGIEAAIESGV